MSSVPHFIADNFLPDDIHQGLLARALNVDDFKVGSVVTNGELTYYPEARNGKVSGDLLGPHLPALTAALRDAFAAICSATGVARFDLADIEIRLAAYGDGEFFSPHRDSLTGDDRVHIKHDRLITAVYYFHQLPRKFVGGELHIHPFDRGAPVVIEPRDNRLVAFPAFMVHEVLPVSVPSGSFADSRFSVSCWLNRKRTVI